MRGLNTQAPPSLMCPRQTLVALVNLPSPPASHPLCLDTSSPWYLLPFSNNSDVLCLAFWAPLNQPGRYTHCCSHSRSPSTTSHLLPCLIPTVTWRTRPFIAIFVFTKDEIEAQRDLGNSPESLSWQVVELVRDQHDVSD